MKSSTRLTRFGVMMTIAMALMITVGCSTNRTMGEQLDDAAITAKIEAKMAGDSQVSAFNVDVDTQDGVVRLSGSVEKASARREAVKIAKDTKGVVRVINDIEVGNRTMGDRLDDSAIVTKIKAKLTGDSEVNALNVNVDSKDGVVTLTGDVETMDAKREAEELAKATKGVRQVNNRIKVVGDGR